MNKKIIVIGIIGLILLVSFSAIPAKNVSANDETNNEGLPDLAFTSHSCKRDLHWPWEPDCFHLIFTITNIGDAPAYLTGGKLKIRHVNYNYNYTIPSIGSGYTIDVIEPGGSVYFDSEKEWQIGFEKNSVQTFIIDPDNDITEKNEDNNKQSFTVSLTKNSNSRTAPLIIKMLECFPFFEKILKMFWV